VENRLDMIVINDVLISDDIIEEHFICNLNACKGACCWEGDYGAPINNKEEHTINTIIEEIKPLLPEESVKIIGDRGPFDHFSEKNFLGTALHQNGACVFMTYDTNGIAKCAFEKAYEESITSFKKPISCHLYPIRVTINKEAGFEAWNYDVWDICSAACKLGKEHKMPIYKFLKDAIIRYKGEAFYEELDAAAKHINS